MNAEVQIPSLESLNYQNKTVLLRVDINSPIDPKTKRIVNENRIKKSIPTIKYLLNQGAKLAILAHQGDSLDYHNLISLKEHAEKLSMYLNKEITYIDDVCGPAAQDAIKKLMPGQGILLGNLRYLAEEISTFENAVKLLPNEMTNTYLVRQLSPIADYYVNDAFSAAHRNAPSMVAFQEVLPFAAGDLLKKELDALTQVMTNPKRPAVFLLGGLKISDAFGMIEQVLKNKTADKILVGGVTGEIFLMAQNIHLGKSTEIFIADRSLNKFVEPARMYLEAYPDKIVIPSDLAYEKNQVRKEVKVIHEMPDEMYLDIGNETIHQYNEILNNAGTIFVNGPMGVYEKSTFEEGTKTLLQTISKAEGFSVIGGGDSVNAATQFVDLKTIDYICTAGGAMVRFLSGEKLPLIEAMQVRKEEK